jgi:hypothetical protein
MALILSDFHTKTHSETLGDVTLRFIDGVDTPRLEKLVRKAESDRSFTVQALYHQLDKPIIELNQLEVLSNAELIKLGKVFSQEQLNRNLEEVADDDFFRSFRDAVKGKIWDDYRMSSEALLKLSNNMSGLFNNVATGLVNKQLSDVINKVSDYYLNQAEKIGKMVNESTLLQRKSVSEAMNWSKISDSKFIFPKANVAVPTLNKLFDTQETISKRLLEIINKQLPLPTDFGLDFITQQINSISKWVSVNSDIFSNISDFWKDFEQKYRIREEKAVRVLRKYNWFVSPSLRERFVFDVVKLSSRKGNQRKAVNKLFWDYFSENEFQNLEFVVEKWADNPIFKPRMKIFRDCVSMLKNAKKKDNPANVLIPTLIAQIEGIAIAYRKKKGFKFTANKQKERQQEWRLWFVSETTNQAVLSQQMLELTNYIFFDVLFQTAIPGQPLDNPFTFSRHKIQHGEFFRYGRKDNLIRAFLVLDFLAALK